MSRFRQALAATAMAVAATGGGLLSTAAGAAPASAAATAAAPAPARVHTITITASPVAPATRPNTTRATPGSGPAIKPSLACQDDLCPTITCRIDVSLPRSTDSGDPPMTAAADTHCDHHVNGIFMVQDLITAGVVVQEAVASKFDVATAHSEVPFTCADAYYVNQAQATITWPPGYDPNGQIGQNPIHDATAPFLVPPDLCDNGGGGGGGGNDGGGCSPGIAGQPSGRHPDLITC